MMLISPPPPPRGITNLPPPSPWCYKSSLHVVLYPPPPLRGIKIPPPQFHGVTMGQTEDLVLQLCQLTDLKKIREWERHTLHRVQHLGETHLPENVGRPCLSRMLRRQNGFRDQASHLRQRQADHHSRKLQPCTDSTPAWQGRWKESHTSSAGLL